MDRLVQTATVLAAGATYTSDWQSGDKARSLSLMTYSDAPSALNGVIVEETDEPSITNMAYPVALASASGLQPCSLRGTVMRRYFRVRYINGATAQTTFQLYASGSGDPMLAVLFELQRMNQNLLILRESMGDVRDYPTDIMQLQ